MEEELALWRPSASIDALRKRRDMIARIRAFFNEREYLEVETPVMGKFGITDVYLSNIKAQFRKKPYCLQTSPEYHMKRLLADGSGPIYQFARVFRDDELGRWHNPEFTMLEWYQLGVDHHQLMAEVSLLLQEVLQGPPLIKKTYQSIFLESLNLDPLSANRQALQQALVVHGLEHVLAEDEEDLDQYLFLLMSHVVEPYLAKESAPVAVYDFPASQAALAQLQQGVACRFEVFYRGIELMNGFYELTDPKIQRERFQQDNVKRQALSLDECPIDEYFIQALEAGLPACSGVALGLERLIALALDYPSISGTLAFDFSRA